MRKRFINLLPALLLPLLALVASCGSKSSDVNRLVDMFNSADFRSQLASTGYISSSDAVQNDTAVVVTLHCTKLVDIASLPDSYRSAMQLMARELFTEGMKDPIVSKGMTALDEEGKKLVLLWQDTKGSELGVVVNPAEILSAVPATKIDEPGADLTPDPIPAQGAKDDLSVTEP